MIRQAKTWRQAVVTPFRQRRVPRVDSISLINVWQAIIRGPNKSWVLYKNGTCVILLEPMADLAVHASALLGEFGPVHAGSSFGDFGIITLDDEHGWVVTCHHNDILTFVGHDEVDENPEELAIGLLGRSKRGQDAEELQVLHVEDNRQL